MEPFSIGKCWFGKMATFCRKPLKLLKLFYEKVSASSIWWCPITQGEAIESEWFFSVHYGHCGVSEVQYFETFVLEGIVSVSWLFLPIWDERTLKDLNDVLILTSCSSVMWRRVFWKMSMGERVATWGCGLSLLGFGRGESLMLVFGGFSSVKLLVTQPPFESNERTPIDFRSAPGG